MLQLLSEHYYYILNTVYYFVILYHTYVYNEFKSISEYPFMFSNYITMFLSMITVYLFNKKKLSAINRRKLYYVCIGYNIVLYIYLNIAIWFIPNYFYSFKVVQQDLFTDPSYLSYLITLMILTLTVISILKKEYFKYKELLRYISVV